MRMFAGMIVLAAGILGNLGAAPIQSVDVFTPGKENALLLFHRRDNSQIRNFPVSGNPITVDRADAPEAAYFDCQANPAQNVPEFTRATFRSRVFLPPGHPVRSFNLRLIEIGNENYNFSSENNNDQSDHYAERYQQFYEAIRAKYPDVTIIGNVEAWGTDNPSWRNPYPVDVVDEHYYRNPSWFVNQYNKYDSYSRSAHKSTSESMP